MKKFLLHSSIYATVLLIILNLIGIGVFMIHQKSMLYKPSFIANTVPDQSYDYIILGSSMGLTSINTILVDELTGLNGLNASMDDTSLASHYLMLKHFLESGGEVKTCYVAVNPGDLANKQPSYSNNDYRFLPYIHHDYVCKAINEREEGINPLKVSYYLPFVGASYYNLELTASSIQALVEPKKRNRFDEKGNYSYPVAGKSPSNQSSEQVIKWQNPYIEKLEDIAKANNIQLIYYQPPIFNTQVVNHDETKLFLNHSHVLKDATLFYDKIHVNKKGREEVSILFAEEMLIPKKQSK